MKMFEWAVILVAILWAGFLAYEMRATSQTAWITCAYANAVKYYQPGSEFPDVLYCPGSPRMGMPPAPPPLANPTPPGQRPKNPYLPGAIGYVPAPAVKPPDTREPYGTVH